MKKVLIISLIAIAIVVISFAVTNNKAESECYRQGCCSNHGGVCGCGGSRLMCCDGTLSPSCPCY